MGETEEKVAGLNTIRECVTAELNSGFRLNLANRLLDLLTEAISHGAHGQRSYISAQLSRKSARGEIKDSTFKSALPEIAEALQTCRRQSLDIPATVPDRPGLACVRTIIKGAPHLLTVTGPTSNDRGMARDRLLRLTADFEPLPVLTEGPETIAPSQVIAARDEMPKSPGALLPLRPPILIGRETALLDLKERLFDSTAATAGHLQVLAAIDGLPGVGKTTIAAALAHDAAVGNCFPDGVLWTSLGQSPDVLLELLSWGRALRIPYVLEIQSIQEASAALAAALRDRRALLIVDDAWAVEHAEPFRVGGRECATLITTRAPIMANALAAIPQQVYSLPVLSLEASRELLTALAPAVVREHPDAVRELLRELDGLPLAIQVAGRLLASQSQYGFDVAELLLDLRKGARLLEALAPADYSDIIKQTTPTVAALFRKSTDVLPPTVRERFAYLGTFAPKPARFDLAILRYLWATDDPTPTVRTLLNYGLIEATTETDQYQIHSLIALHARSLASR